MFKKFGRGLSSGTLRIFLLILALVAAFTIVFGTSARIKTALTAGDVYGNFVDNALDQAKESSKKQPSSSNDVPFDQPEVRAAAKTAVPPVLLQTSAENALDGIYAWLQSKTSTPQFTIDLSTAKQTFATEVGNSLTKRIQGLPVCTQAQLQSTDVNDIDLFNLPCKPPGIDLEVQRQKVVSDIASNKDFLDKPVLTAQNLPKNDQGQTVFEQAPQAPKAYERLMSLPWVLGFIALVSAGVLVLLHDSKKRAVRSIATSFVGIAAILLASSWLVSWLFKKATASPSVTAHNSGLQQSGIKVANHLSNDVSGVIICFAIGYLIIGALLFGLWWWLGKRQSPIKAAKTQPSKDSPSTAPSHPSPPSTVG